MNERDIFTAARGMTDPAARSAYLDGACGGDAALRERLETLLRADDEPDSLLDAPAVGPTVPGRGPTRAFLRPGGNPDDGPTHAQGEGGDETDDALGFLAPAGRPDSLGRIGHYEVLEVLGRGAFGVVFRAFDDVLQRVVAVKVLSPSLATTSPARKRFLREARAAAPIQHEGVVRVIETGEQPLPYLVMEFVAGETLQQRLDRTGPLEVPEVLKIARQVAEGLAAAHEQGLIHRDIKPSNIMIERGPQERAKITDFGLARAADDASLTRSGVVAGTPMYMAPEQAKGESLDHRADLFSLGSVIYAMLTGHPPFRAESTLAVLKRVADDAPRPIREVIPEVPEWLCRIVEKLHAKNPAERFQTAREVAELLADCEKQLAAHKELQDFARIPGGKPRRRRVGRRAKWAAAVCLLILGSAIWAGPAAVRFARNRATVEFVPQPGLQSVIVLQDDAVVHDWTDMSAGRTLSLPPGTYRLNMALQPGYDYDTSGWEVERYWVLGGNKVTIPGPSLITSVSRGERVTIRPVIREAAKPPPSISDEGFVPLFDGTGLAGWKIHPKEANQGQAWNISFGVLTLKGPIPTHLFSERGDFRDFHLRIEARCPENSEATVGLRAPFTIEDGGPTEGIARTPGTRCKGTGLGNNAANFFNGFRFTSKGAGPAVKPGEWFTQEWIIKGDFLEIRVNGEFFMSSSGLPSRSGHIVLRMPPDQVQFRKIEIKELPAPKLPDAAEQALPALAGQWKGEFNQKTVNGKPAPLKLDSNIVIDWVSGQRFLRQRVQHGNTGDLQVMTFDQPTGNFRSWFFNAHGMALGPSVGRWDGKTRTITWTNLPEADTVGVKTLRFVDADTVTWDVVFRDKAGTILYEGSGRMARTAEKVEINEDLSPGPLPPELDVLNRLVGDWQTTGTLKTTDNPAGFKFETRVSSRKVFGGRYIESRETGLPGHPDAYWLTTFDAKLKAYRFWMFNADGNVMELGGGWNDKTQTMAWNSAGRDGSQTVGTWRWIDSNRREWTTVTKDAGGKTTLDIQAASVRKTELPGPVTDKQRLQGLWVAEYAERTGLPLPGDQRAQIRLHFDGGNIRVTMPNGKSDSGTFKLDSEVIPKQIDVIGTDQKGRLGIYQLDGAKLGIVMGEGKDRPKEFRSSPVDATRIYVILKRAPTQPPFSPVALVIAGRDGAPERAFTTATGIVEAADEKDRVEVRGLPNDPSDVKVKQLREELVELRRKNAGKREAIVAAKLMAQLAWPLDGLKREQITPEQFASIGFKDAAKCPAEVVAVVGKGGGWMSLVAISPDGRWLAYTVRKGEQCKDVAVWDVEKGAVRHTLTGHLWDVTGLAFSPDGKTLASASKDRTVKLWDVETGGEGPTLDGPDTELYSVAFSTDGKSLAAGGRQLGDGSTLKVFLWDVEKRKLEKKLDAPDGYFISSVAFSPDGKTLAGLSTATGSVAQIGNAAVRFWEVPGGKVIDTLATKYTGEARGALRALAFSPDGKTLTAPEKMPTLKLWDTNPIRERRTLSADPEQVLFGVAFSPDGELLAATGRDHVALWNAKTGVKASKVELKLGGAVAFAPDGRHLAVCREDGIVVILRLK